MPLTVTNPVSGFTKNKTNTWAECWTQNHNRAGDQKGWAACVLLHAKAPGKVCMRRGPQLLGQKSQQQCRKKLPASKSNFFRCSLPGWWTNIGRKITFKINYFRPFSLPLCFPKWKRDVQKQCLLWIDHTQGRGPLLTRILRPVTKEWPQPAFISAFGRKEAELFNH